MSDEKFAGKKMSDDQLDNVAGGTYFDSMEVADFLQKAGYEGLTKESGGVNFGTMRDAIKDMGFKSEDHGGLFNENTYVQESTGKKFSQKEFMDFLHQKYPSIK